jgi:predicted RNA-binding protein with PUA-like domain
MRVTSIARVQPASTEIESDLRDKCGHDKCGIDLRPHRSTLTYQLRAAFSPLSPLPSPHMNYWLMKTEPDEFSIDDLKRKKVEPWSGVRNYQARNYMRDGMRKGDGVLFYHSSCAVPGVAGIAEVATDAYPDPTQFDPRSDYFDAGSKRDAPRWLLVDVKFKRKLKRVIALSELKERKALKDMILLRPGNRLSVSPVSEAEWEDVLSLE